MITDSTRIIDCTVQDLMEYIVVYLKANRQEIFAESGPRPEDSVEPFDLQNAVRGIDGIAKYFGISRVTATEWKNTILAGAIFQKGRKVYMDPDKAKMLLARK